MSAQSDTTDTIKSLLDIVKTLKGFIDLQSSRIDRLEKNEDKVNLILSRYQMTEGKDDIEIYESVGGGFDFDEGADVKSS